jgi:hypothetical protein
MSATTATRRSATKTRSKRKRQSVDGETGTSVACRAPRSAARMSPAQAYLAGYKAASAAQRQSTRGERVWLVSIYVAGAAWVMFLCCWETLRYLRDAGQLVSERTCQPFVAREFERLQRRFEEQRPRAFVDLRDQDLR